MTVCCSVCSSASRYLKNRDAKHCGNFITPSSPFLSHLRTTVAAEKNSPLQNLTSLLFSARPCSKLGSHSSIRCSLTKTQSWKRSKFYVRPGLILNKIIRLLRSKISLYWAIPTILVFLVFPRR